MIPWFRPAAAAGLAASVGCVPPLVIPEGLLDRPLALWTGEERPATAPSLAFVDEGCPGRSAAGGCPDGGPRTCRPLLLDTLAAESALPHRDPAADALALSTECLELRPAAGLGNAPPSAQDLARSVVRLRLHELPVLRVPSGGAPGSTEVFRHGTEAATFVPGGVLGGHAMASFAVEFQLDAAIPTVTFYDIFPGRDRDLAREGLAFLPVQYPGRLLGRNRNDRCLVDGKDCELPKGVDLVPGDDRLALAPFRMVMDACMAPPPCTVTYTPAASDEEPGSCGRAAGPDAPAACAAADGAEGGRAASLVVATSVPDLVLFDDSATRLFGPPEDLPPCVPPLPSGTRACLDGLDGRLYLAGFPPAGDEEAPLPVLRVRALALVPGAVQAVADGPCTRLAARLAAAEQQCDRYRRTARMTGSLRETTPPYSANPDDDEGDDADAAAVVLGEAFLAQGTASPDPDRWIRVRVVPADHLLAVSVRRSVYPDALEPDGIIGTALFSKTRAVLDHTDPNPALRIACLAPHEGRCLALTECRDDGDPACCHGMPRALLWEFAAAAGTDACCHALSPEDQEALAEAGAACPPPS